MTKEKKETAMKLFISLPTLQDVKGINTIFEALLRDGESFTRIAPNEIWHETLELFVDFKRYEKVEGVYRWRLKDSFWESELFSNFEKEQADTLKRRAELFEEKKNEQN